MVYYGRYPGEVPLPLQKRRGYADALIPVCTAFAGEARKLAGYISTAGGATVRGHLAGFAKYSRDDEPAVKHQITTLDVLSPHELKWRYPAGQTTFNPATAPGETAHVVEARYADACAGERFSFSKCAACWRLPTPFSNAAAIQGNIAYISDRSTETTTPCALYFYEFLFAAQLAGAEALVMGTRSRLPLLGPYLVPFQVSIPMFTMLDSMLVAFENTLDEGTPIVATLPRITHGSGPDYFLPQDDEGALDNTKLSFRIGPGVHAQTVDMFAGQARYNPYNAPSLLNVPVVRGDVAPECAEAPPSAAGALTGVNCDVCVELVDNGTALRGDYASQVVFVMATDMFCLQHWLDMSRMAEGKHAAALLIGNNDEVTWYLRSDEPDTRLATTATYNLPKTQAAALGRAIDAQADGGGSGHASSRRLGLASAPRALAELGDQFVTVNLPRIVNGSAPSPASKVEALRPTQVQVTFPSSLKGFKEAGQALFNPVTDAVEGEIVVPQLSSACAGTHSCFYCQLLEHPFRNDISGKIAMVALDKVGCMNPVANYVVLARDAGALGVLFVETAERLVALGPADAGVNVTIPSFVILPSLAANITSALQRTSVKVRLPFIEDVEDGAAETSGHDPVVDTPTGTGGTHHTAEPGQDDDGRSADDDPNRHHTIDPETVTPADHSGEVPVVWIVVAVVVALVLGAAGAVKFTRWRRQRRLGAYNQVTTGQQTDAFGGPVMEMHAVGPGTHKTALLSRVDGATSMDFDSDDGDDDDDDEGAGAGAGTGTAARAIVVGSALVHAGPYGSAPIPVATLAVPASAGKVPLQGQGLTGSAAGRRALLPPVSSSAGPGRPVDMVDTAPSGTPAVAHLSFPATATGTTAGPARVVDAACGDDTPGVGVVVSVGAGATHGVGTSIGVGPDESGMPDPYAKPQQQPPPMAAAAAPPPASSHSRHVATRPEGAPSAPESMFAGPPAAPVTLAAAHAAASAAMVASVTETMEEAPPAGDGTGSVAASASVAAAAETTPAWLNTNDTDGNPRDVGTLLSGPDAAGRRQSEPESAGAGASLAAHFAPMPPSKPPTP